MTPHQLNSEQIRMIIRQAEYERSKALGELLARGFRSLFALFRRPRHDIIHIRTERFRGPVGGRV